MIGRRGFLGLLAGAAVAPLLPAPKVEPIEPKVEPIESPARVWVNEEMQYRDLPYFKVGDKFTVRLPQRYGPPKDREFVVTGSY